MARGVTTSGLGVPLAVQFDSLSSFDRVNVGVTFFQATLAIAFAAAVRGAAAHFKRPAMHALSVYWILTAFAATINIGSAWAGAVLQDKVLSRFLTTCFISLLGAGIPWLRVTVESLRSPGFAPRPPRGSSVRWLAGTWIVHAIGVFGLGYLFADQRVFAVEYSRITHLVVFCIPLVMTYRAWRSSPEHPMALRLLGFGLAALTARQFLRVLIGLTVGGPNSAWYVDLANVTFDVLCTGAFGAFSLLTLTAEELVLVERQSAALTAARATTAARERLESLGRLATGIAHDFNNILMVIGLSAEAMRAVPAAAQAAPNELGEIDRATESGRTLVAQLLGFAKRRPEASREFDVCEHLSGMRPFLTRLIGSGRTLEMTVTDSPRLVTMDPSQFDQITLNLVVNARDALPTNGTIRLSVELQHIGFTAARDLSLAIGDYVVLVVADTGAGMSEQTLAHLFEPFFTTKADGQGNGLGLATVDAIVKGAGGDIVVNSVVGKGTTFRVFLPAA